MSPDKSQESGEQRFEVVEALVAEHVAQGSSPTLTAWIERIHGRLEPLTREGGMRERRVAAKIDAAYASAAELVKRLASERGAAR